MIIELIPFDTKYAQSIAKYANNKRIADNLRNAFPYPYSLDDAKKWIETTINAGEEKQIVRIITVDGEAVGAVGVHGMSDVYCKSAEIGYWLAEPFWGRGIMTECIKEICALAFEKFDIVRIFAEIFAFNAGSEKVLQKAGFKFEGIKKKSVFKNGKIHDSKVYASVK